MQLRPYQREAVAAVHREWAEGRLKTLLGQATGTGKTVEFSQITKDQVDQGERVLQLAHREELLTQASDKLKELTGLDTVLEKAGSSSLGSFVPVTVGSVQSMAQAIKDGYLVPIRAQMIPLELNLEGVKVSNGDYSAGDIGCALEPYLEQIADEMVKYCKGKKTVVFLPLIATSQKFCEMLKRRGLRAAEVNGNSEDRAQILKTGGMTFCAIPCC